MSDETAVPTKAAPLEAKRIAELRRETLARIDYEAIEPQLPQEWQRRPLPDWLQETGERLYVHTVTSARLFRYITAWEDGTWQEMWSVYVSSNSSPDSVCVRLDLALAMHERHRSSKFLRKGQLLPWRI